MAKKEILITKKYYNHKLLGGSFTLQVKEFYIIRVT